MSNNNQFSSTQQYLEISEIKDNVVVLKKEV